MLMKHEPNLMMIHSSKQPKLPGAQRIPHLFPAVESCNLEDEKSLGNRKGRGSFDYKAKGNHSLEWQEGIHTFVSHCWARSCAKNIQQWNKAIKSYTEAEMPFIVGPYSKCMGSKDLLDSFVVLLLLPLHSHRGSFAQKANGHLGSHKLHSQDRTSGSPGLKQKQTQTNQYRF